jgi:hypothetical protein
LKIKDVIDKIINLYSNIWNGRFSNLWLK